MAGQDKGKIEEVLGLSRGVKSPFKSLDTRAQSSQRQTPPDLWRHLFFNPFDTESVAWDPDILGPQHRHPESRGDKVISGAIPIELASLMKTPNFFWPQNISLVLLAYQ